MWIKDHYCYYYYYYYYYYYSVIIIIIIIISTIIIIIIRVNMTYWSLKDSSIHLFYEAVFGGFNADETLYTGILGEVENACLFFQPSSVWKRLSRSCKANLFRLDKFENSVHLLYGKRRTDNSVAVKNTFAFEGWKLLYHFTTIKA